MLGHELGSKALENRAYGLRAEIDWFIDGGRIFVRPDFTDGDGWMARLEPPGDEVWELRSLKPKPSLRVFGSIVRRDMFVALTWALRKDLGFKISEEWKEAVKQFKAEWQSYFGTLEPMTGSYPDDYLSKAKLI